MALTTMLTTTTRQNKPAVGDGEIQNRNGIIAFRSIKKEVEWVECNSGLLEVNSVSTLLNVATDSMRQVSLEIWNKNSCSLPLLRDTSW